MSDKDDPQKQVRDPNRGSGQRFRPSESSTSSDYAHAVSAMTHDQNRQKVRNI